MSDYIPKDPLTPNPNDRAGYDRYGNARFEPAMDDGAGKGPYILLGLLAAIGLIGGMLYFNGPDTNTEVAPAPRPAIERTAPNPAPAVPATPATPAAPAATPATPATPAAPATPQ